MRRVSRDFLCDSFFNKSGRIADRKDVDSLKVSQMVGQRVWSVEEVMSENEEKSALSNKSLIKLVDDVEAYPRPRIYLWFLQHLMIIYSKARSVKWQEDLYHFQDDILAESQIQRDPLPRSVLQKFAVCRTESADLWQQSSSSTLTRTCHLILPELPLETAAVCLPSNVLCVTRLHFIDDQVYWYMAWFLL